VLFGRPEPRRHLREAGAQIALSLGACLLLFVLARSTLVVDAITFGPNGVELGLGPLGKAYLGYLAFTMLLVLLNMEGMLRAAREADKARFSRLFFAILVAILAELLVVSAGVLYGRITVAWLGDGLAGAVRGGRGRGPRARPPPTRRHDAACRSSRGLPLVGVGHARGRVPRVHVRPVAAAPGDLERDAWLGVRRVPRVRGRWRGAPAVRPATGRAIRRFVDRNFYAYRYDYRREWGACRRRSRRRRRLTRSLARSNH
jgi:hypothetical protein